jgi:hypothetical protein
MASAARLRPGDLQLALDAERRLLELEDEIDGEVGAALGHGDAPGAARGPGPAKERIEDVAEAGEVLEAVKAGAPASR